MGAIYEEFLRELAALERKHQNRPRHLLIDLFLMALEREEIVSIAYRDSVMATRLRSMPLPDDVRDLVRHALLWAWKDEEMHAVYIRGAILKLGNRLLRLQAFLRQNAGSVGGWATSVQQHVTWREGPVARTISGLITGTGSLLGAVPPDVRQFLRYGPFRDFCLFNIDAEKTAWHCWWRIHELAATEPGLTPALLADFRRIQDDEDRHCRLFTLLAESIGPDDKLVAGVTAEGLAARIEEVGEFFLPRRLRRASVQDNPLGGGGEVHVVQGDAAADKLATFRQLLDQVGLPGLIEERCRRLGQSAAELKVAVKTCFMLATQRRDRAHVIDPELLQELAKYLREHGCTDIAVLENRNIYDSFYGRRSVRDVARHFGYESPHYRLVDLSEEQVPHSFGRGMAQETVGRTWRDADLRLAFGKMRSHPVEMVYLTVPTLEAIGLRCEEFLFADRQAHRDSALMMLLTDFPAHLALLDAYDQAADGLAGMMGCTNPKTPRRLYGGRDALAVDIVAARHMGLRDVSASQVLRAAVHWFGDPSDHIRIVGCDRPLPRWRGPYSNEVSTLLSFLAYPLYEHGSGRGTLFVPEMDRDAFPPVGRETSLLRVGRRFTQTVLGLRHRR